VAAEIALIGSKNGSNARNFAIRSMAMQRFGSSVAHGFNASRTPKKTAALRIAIALPSPTRD
jgi:hypothetical protein